MKSQRFIYLAVLSLFGISVCSISADLFTQPVTTWQMEETYTWTHATHPDRLYTYGSNTGTPWASAADLWLFGAGGVGGDEHAQLSSAGFGRDGIGRALVLSGQGRAVSDIRVNGHPTNVSWGSMKMEFWFNPASLEANDNVRMVEIRGIGSISLNSDGDVTFTILRGNADLGTETTYATIDNAATAGAWHHLVASIDHTGRQELIIDGVSVINITSSKTLRDDYSQGTFTIGSNWQGNGLFYTGMIDDFSVSIVPEPATISLLVFGSIALVKTRRKR